MRIVFEERDRKKLLTLSFEQRVWAKNSLPTIGAVWNHLKNESEASHVSKVQFDFSNTIWVEVPTLLAVATLANQISKRTSIELKFDGKGIVSAHQQQRETEIYEGKLKFLSFLRSMKFFSTLPQTAKISIGSANEDSKEPLRSYNPEEFERLVNGISFQPFIQAVTLIPLHVMKASEFQQDGADGKDGSQRLKSKLKTINENAALNIASAGIQKGTMQRQRILLSVDKILQESLSNIIEHAYSPSDENSYFAFYARIRNPNSAFDDEFKNGLYSSDDEFDHSKDVNWTELYVCDLGCGLEAQVPHWLRAEQEKSTPNRKLISELLTAINSKNLFLRASRLLFDHSLSRHAERSGFRSPQTGLQDVKRVLVDAGYVDITNCSSVNRRRFSTNREDQNRNPRASYQESRTPFLITDQERKDILDQFPNRSSLLRCEAGTHLVYRSQLSSELPPFKQSGYRSIGKKQAAKILEIYRGNQKVPENHLLIDKRFAQTSQPTDKDVREIIEVVRKQPRDQKITLYVRLSRNPYKNDVNEWLRLDNRRHGEELHTLLEKRRVSLALQIVDVLPVYGGWLRERISSFAGSQWLSQSSLVEVGVFTNLFHFVVFEKTNEGYRISRKAAPGMVGEIIAVATALRQMDSVAFWQSYPGNLITDVYIDSEIEWIATKRKLGEPFSNDYPKIWGYLDFASSLQCLERYRVCERALLRFIAIVYNLNSEEEGSSETQGLMFLPTMVSSDSMTQRLAKSVQALFSEVANFNEDSLLILSSVVVTGQTKDRAALGVPSGHDAYANIKVCFFDRATSATKVADGDFSLMLWLPPETNPSKPMAKYKRIFRTAEVSPRGALDIRIPHILARNGQKLESYQRGRAETYSDFELLGALQFGHTQKSNRHELINLNFDALVPLAISTSHASWGWLIDQFYNVERDADSIVLVVYPNQHHTEQLIQELKHREPSRVPSDLVSFISAPFLKPPKNRANHRESEARAAPHRASGSTSRRQNSIRFI